MHVRQERTRSASGKLTARRPAVSSSGPWSAGKARVDSVLGKDRSFRRELFAFREEYQALVWM
jgi:hypothetical protein